MRSRNAPGSDLVRGVTRVIIVDEDPMARQFMLRELSEHPQLGVVAAPDSAALAAPPAVIVLAGSPEHSATAERVQQLAGAGHRVLTIGVRWTPFSIRRVLEVGGCGCIVKSLDIDALVGAIGAAASGHIVVSPELIPTYLHASGHPPAQEPPAPTERAVRLAEVLTSRELQILGMLGDGLATREIASTLFVSAATVKSHVSHALSKLGVRNRTQAVLLVKELGLLELTHTGESSRHTPRSTQGGEK